MNAIFRFFYFLFGWRIVGNIPADLKKAVLVVAPHSSWVDFLIGLGTRAAMKRKIGYLGKAELFEGPFGFIFKALGGTPVKRTEKLNMVEAYAKAIKSSEDMMFALAPEGTRKDVGKLKSGFYYMALGGEIPIIPIGFDYAIKRVIIGEPFQVSGDFGKDMQQYIVPFFKKIAGTEHKTWLKNYEQGKFEG